MFGTERLDVAPVSVPWADARKLLGLTAQLGLALLVIYRFRVENRAFYNVALLAAGGFLVHAMLPLKARLPFFVGLSVASVALVFGIRDGAVLVAIGAGLIGLCHLPVRLWIRVVLLLAAAAVLAASRASLLPSPWAASVWPILGSIFMFRIALYLHALEHDAASVTPVRGAAYFFMLPNVCFPLFPVVDYTTFVRNHFDAEPVGIYQTGLRWITRGLVHLLLYRVVYDYVVLDPTGLANFGEILRHVLGTFLLYLHVSGQFHLIVGILHLFGFRLPETHRLYYLASSFTDFWRRINIYWKDFMMKLVYYPSFFRLRRFGGTVALIGATLIVFVITWLLHSYQWFWLRGDFPIETPDLLFWGILGVLVIINALREARRGRDRSLGTRKWSASLAIRTVATFTTICILWSLWSAESIGEWFAMWTAATRVRAIDAVVLIALIAFGLAIGGRTWAPPALARREALPWYRRSGTLTTAALLVLVALSQPNLYSSAAPQVASFVSTIQRPGLNARDEAVRHKGYYEKLDNVNRLSSQLWDVVAEKPEWWVGLSATEAYRTRSDFLAGELTPSTSITYLRQPLQTNRWGMRDRDYERAKPRGTFRIAVLGPSHVMGSAVADGEPFEARLEALLNEAAGDSAASRYEVLNFGVPAYSLVQQMALLEDRVLDFSPDMVIVTAEPRLDLPIADHLKAMIGQNVAIPYPGLQEILTRIGVGDQTAAAVPIPSATLRALATKLGVDNRVPGAETLVRLRLGSDEIIAWTLGRIAEQSRAHGAKPVLLALDNVRPQPARRHPAIAPARAAGFLVLDFLDVYGSGSGVTAFQVEPWDEHPNPRGHQIIAERLLQELRRHDAIPAARTPAQPSTP